VSGHIASILASCGPRGWSKDVERMLEVVGEGFHGEHLGTSLVVSPRRLSEGEYALVDLSEREVEEKKL
jgi:hypothetical protein